jgi:hypothetical protein
MLIDHIVDSFWSPQKLASGPWRDNFLPSPIPPKTASAEYNDQHYDQNE